MFSYRMTNVGPDVCKQLFCLHVIIVKLRVVLLFVKFGGHFRILLSPSLKIIINVKKVRGRGLLQTDRRTDITTGLHIAFFAFTGAHTKKLYEQHNLLLK